MFRFDRKQEVFDFGKFKLGGQPGEYPTCCIGTMFYARHKIVSDPEHGVFDVAAAERLWNTQVEMSEVTGNSCMNQIVWNKRKRQGSGLKIIRIVLQTLTFTSGTC